MTRYIIGLLLLLNATALAWQWEAFARWGWVPDSAREPERVLMQIRPEAIRIETPEATVQRLAEQAAAAASAKEPGTASLTEPLYLTAPQPAPLTTPQPVPRSVTQPVVKPPSEPATAPAPKPPVANPAATTIPAASLLDAAGRPRPVLTP